MATAPDAARAPYPAYSWASFESLSVDIRIIAALELECRCRGKQQPLSGLRFNASKNGELPGLSACVVRLINP
ncbi:hypothetical protein F6P96_07700 [Escherichia coli]|nr:hypothetical protein F6P96_07700 [Escherichia coli]